MSYDACTEDIWYIEYVGSKNDNQGYQETDMRRLRFKSDVNEITLIFILNVLNAFDC